jgi:hypothetical protein
MIVDKTMGIRILTCLYDLSRFKLAKIFEQQLADR